jgi:Flagellar protein (FlbD).
MPPIQVTPETRIRLHGTLSNLIVNSADSGEGMEFLFPDGSGLLIVVTLLNEDPIAINPEFIGCVHSRPNTTVVMSDGTSLVVAEPMDQLLSMISNAPPRVITTTPARENAHRHEARRVAHTWPRVWNIDDIESRPAH